MSRELIRLSTWRDATADDVLDPITAEVELSNSDGRITHIMNVTCATPAEIVPAAERAIDSLGLDLGVTEWRAA